MTETGADAILKTHGLTKEFNGVTVLHDASVTLFSGECHAFVGENGAGKSTLAKLIAGVHRPTSGSIALLGKSVAFSGPRDAATSGVALIPQEPQTFPDLTVAENIFIGRQPGRFGVVDWRVLNEKAEQLLKTLGVTLNPRAPVRGLSVADRQMIELAAALSRDARVLILDETTASLTPKEVERLAQILDKLKSEGRALAFIGHRMEEIFSLCERVTVLRDGQIVQADRLISETSVDQIVHQMVGRSFEINTANNKAKISGEVALKLTGLTRRKKFTDINFSVHQGEIVALAGLVGAGRTEVARAIFGLLPIDSGGIEILGKATKMSSPRAAMQAGIALVPEDRQQHGALLPWMIWENASLASLAKKQLKLGDAERALAEVWKAQFSVKCQSVEQKISELSGGNQQKVVLGKWLATKPNVLILDEPTRGVDVGAKAQIHEEILRLAQNGLAVLLISSDLPEVLALADRIFVMREGRIVQELSREDATAARVIGAATGVLE
jgi:rhamnose transport system ATP-binding protein